MSHHQELNDAESRQEGPKGGRDEEHNTRANVDLDHCGSDNEAPEQWKETFNFNKAFPKHINQMNQLTLLQSWEFQLRKSHTAECAMRKKRRRRSS